jgi:hypothetical protein
MSATVHRPRHRTAGRSSHLVGALADIALLVVINVSPGWQAVPVLTDAARGVVVAVDISLAVALVINLACLLVPRPWLDHVGEVMSTAVGLAAVLCVLVVFPFRFGDSAVDWTTVVRLGLISIAVVVAIALVVQSVRLVLAARFRVIHGHWE